MNNIFFSWIVCLNKDILFFNVPDFELVIDFNVQIPETCVWQRNWHLFSYCYHIVLFVTLSLHALTKSVYPKIFISMWDLIIMFTYHREMYADLWPYKQACLLFYAMDISGFFSNLWQKTRGDTEDNGIISTYEINNNKDWKTYIKKDTLINHIKNNQWLKKQDEWKGNLCIFILN